MWYVVTSCISNHGANKDNVWKLRQSRFNSLLGTIEIQRIIILSRGFGSVSFARPNLWSSIIAYLSNMAYTELRRNEARMDFFVNILISSIKKMNQGVSTYVFTLLFIFHIHMWVRPYTYSYPVARQCKVFPPLQIRMEHLSAFIQYIGWVILSTTFSCKKLLSNAYDTTC